MIVLYGAPTCISSKKARHWLKKHQLTFVELNIFSSELREETLIKILSLTNNGAEDLISKRSNCYKKLKLEASISQMRLANLISLLQAERKLIRQPLIFDEQNLCIGYNEEEIRVFLPKEIRRQELERNLESIYLDKFQK